MNKLNINLEWNFIQKEVGLANRLNFSLEKRQMLFAFQILLAALPSKSKQKTRILHAFYLKYKKKYLIM